MKVFYYLLFLSLLYLTSPLAQGQTDNNKVVTDTIPTLEFGEQDEILQTKKKKVKKKVFYGLKCKRGFTSKGEGQRMVMESFFFLKSYKDPNPYVKNIYVYDVRKQQIVELTEIDEKNKPFYKILHGPYKKTQNGSVIETGVFYIGTKHARWEKYGPLKTEVFFNSEAKEKSGGEEEEKAPKTEIEYSILLSKEKYYRGWPKEARISFYDGTHTKVKEVYPVIYGKLNGDYVHFKENGDLLMRGKYIDGTKSGLWIEYHASKNQKKKEIKYPKSPYDEDQFEPLVLTEWDEKGTLIVSNGQPVEAGKKAADPLKEKFKRNKTSKKK